MRASSNATSGAGLSMEIHKDAEGMFVATTMSAPLEPVKGATVRDAAEGLRRAYQTYVISGGGRLA
jgi:hypothetical protein